MENPQPETTENKQDPIQAFNTIALSLSGGGYRASAFHLGSMAYLKRVGLLEKVTIISTVSGGTFTGALYALYLSRGKSFEDCYKDLYACMDEIDLVEEGLKILATGKAPDGMGSHNLINAMAEVYHRKFFKEGLFGEILDANAIHLKEIIFNATEFQYGLPFRFQSTQSSSARIGNGQVNISRQTASEIRLADIVAASSCFPGGFEPLKFPHDFIHDKEPELTKLKETRPFLDGVGLMDGGIVDNQGIGGVLTSIDRTEKNNKKDYPDLFIISDVSSRYMQPLSFPAKFYSQDSGISLGVIKVGIIGLMVLVAIFALLYVALFILRWQQGDVPGLLIEFFGIIIMSGLFLLLNVVRTTLNDKILGHIPHIGNKAWAYLKKISIKRLTEMMTVRASSMITMVSDVNMKQVRRLIYAQVHTNANFEFSRVSNLIDSLTKDRVIERIKDPKYADLRNPSEALLAVAENARWTDTTLWFDKGDKTKLRDLIACGEFTLCFRLLENILKRYGTDAATYPPAIQLLYTQLLKDWDEFNKNPWFMVEGHTL